MIGDHLLNETLAITSPHLHLKSVKDRCLYVSLFFRMRQLVYNISLSIDALVRRVERQAASRIILPRGHFVIQSIYVSL